MYKISIFLSIALIAFGAALFLSVQKAIYLEGERERLLEDKNILVRQAQRDYLRDSLQDDYLRSLVMECLRR